MTDPAHPAFPGAGAVSRGPRAASPDPNAAPRSGAPADAPHIGGLLVAKGVVSEDQIRIATIEQKRRQEPLGRILVRFGFATESVIRDVLAGVLGYDTIDLSNVVIDGEVVKLVPKEIARRYRVLPLTWDAAARRLTVATPDPFNVIALDQVRGLFEPGVEVRAALAGEVEIDKAIDRLYGHELSVDGILKEIETGEIDRRSLEAESGEYSRPVVRLVNALLSDAVKRGASDVHFEPEREFLRIRYRIDGVLRQIRSLCATTRNLSVWTVFLWFEIRTGLLWLSVIATATCCFSRQCPLPRWGHLPSSRVSPRFHHSVGLRVARAFSTTQRLTRVSAETPPVRASVSSRRPAPDRG